jgi:hypothetical protein
MFSSTFATRTQTCRQRNHTQASERSRNVTVLAAATKRQYDSFKQQRQHQEQFVELLSYELQKPVSCIAGNVELLYYYYYKV